MIQLPISPGPVAVQWELVDFGTTLRGGLGGSSQRINRLGNRWRVTVTMPPMAPEQGRVWFARLTRALRSGASWQIRQVGTPTGSPGAVRLNGGGQAGAAIVLDGFLPGYAVREGQWLSIITGPNRYLYQSAGFVMANASGQATVEVEPLLRVAPGDNDPVEIGLPLIEGLLDVAPGLLLDERRLAAGFSFTIEETR